MGWRDLREFLAALDERGDLHRVAAPVTPRLEVAAIADRVAALPDGGPALLFEQVAGSPLPLAVNLFGSHRRVSMALGCESLGELPARMEEFLTRGGGAFAPVASRHAPCREIREQASLCDLLPIPTAWPEDGAPVHPGRFLTLPVVVTPHPSDGGRNLGTYRVACFSGSELGVHWRPASGGARHHALWRQAGEPMPIAILLGPDPATIFCATLPLPDRIPEMELAGFLRGTPLELTKCLTSDLLVPAQTEIVIEGLVDPFLTRPEGAFGNHTGYYGGGGDVPLVRVTAVTRRRGAIMPATLTGPPPRESHWLALAGSRAMLPLLQRQVPTVVDLALPREGIYHGAAIVAIRKERAGQGREVMEALWSAGLLSQSRLLVIVDQDLNPADFGRAYWRTLNHVVWGRDLVLAEPGDTSLPAGGRLGIDATRKLPGEGGCGAWPGAVARPAAIDELVTRRWREYGFTE